jgi:hypothetical protein
MLKKSIKSNEALKWYSLLCEYFKTWVWWYQKLANKVVECNVWLNIEIKNILESLKKANEVNEMSRTLNVSDLTKFY